MQCNASYILIVFSYAHNLRLSPCLGLTCSLLFPYSFLCRNWELNAAWTGAKINVPVKFIVGDLDLTYNVPGTKDYIHKGGFKRDVPLLEEVVVLEGVGHFIHEEKPDEINRHIYDFFQKFWLAFWPLHIVPSLLTSCVAMSALVCYHTLLSGVCHSPICSFYISIKPCVFWYFPLN